MSKFHLVQHESDEELVPVSCSRDKYGTINNNIPSHRREDTLLDLVTKELVGPVCWTPVGELGQRFDSFGRFLAIVGGLFVRWRSNAGVTVSARDPTKTSWFPGTNRGPDCIYSRPAGERLRGVNSYKGFMDALLFEESLMTQRYATKASCVATSLKEVNRDDDDDDDDDVIKRLTRRFPLPERCDYRYRSLGGQLDDSDWLLAELAKYSNVHSVFVLYRQFFIESDEKYPGDLISKKYGKFRRRRNNISRLDESRKVNLFDVRQNAAIIRDKQIGITVRGIDAIDTSRRQR
ncbi:hypothetical protein WN51_01293 [Melipona quadrifasciata]|uniref:Uncharacterized protein n=1 Tax=Melipona quadrifasciata TaxID=166423 RepID=A0A0M8ZY78_9HYME|nr:hypothetical protein WN51_01293 [Melipona quadrifasciata]